jgi:hypothetical protein
MSNVTAAPAAPSTTPVKPFPSLYTTEDLKKYYEKQIDQKFQKRKENVEIVNGHEVFYSPMNLQYRFSSEADAPLVEDVLVDIIDRNSGKVMCKAYPWEVVFVVEKGYTPTPQPGDKPKLQSLGTFHIRAEEFCRTYEKFDEAD